MYVVSRAGRQVDWPLGGGGGGKKKEVVEENEMKNKVFLRHKQMSRRQIFHCWKISRSMYLNTIKFKGIRKHKWSRTQQSFTVYITQ